METTPQFYANKEEVKRSQEVAKEYNARGYEKGMATLRLSKNTEILVPRERLKDEAFIQSKREKYNIKRENKTRIA